MSRHPPHLPTSRHPSFLQNVLLDAEGRALVCDFGIAKFKDRTFVSTANGQAGTPAYMAPEMFDGAGITEKVDGGGGMEVFWEGGQSVSKGPPGPGKCRPPPGCSGGGRGQPSNCLETMRPSSVFLECHACPNVTPSNLFLELSVSQEEIDPSSDTSPPSNPPRSTSLPLACCCGRC